MKRKRETGDLQVGVPSSSGGGGVWQRVKRGHSYLQVTSLSLPFHLVSFGKKESFFYLGTGLKTNYFPTSAKRRTQLEALFVLDPLKQIGS